MHTCNIKLIKAGKSNVFGNQETKSQNHKHNSYTCMDVWIYVYFSKVLKCTLHKLSSILIGRRMFKTLRASLGDNLHDVI